MSVVRSVAGGTERLERGKEVYVGGQWVMLLCSWPASIILTRDCGQLVAVVRSARSAARFLRIGPSRLASRWG